jgi:hypothetical protein
MNNPHRLRSLVTMELRVSKSTIQGAAESLRYVARHNRDENAKGYQLIFSHIG